MKRVRIICFAVLTAACLGCSRTRYIPVYEESVRIRTDTVLKYIRDSAVTSSMLREREFMEIRDSIVPVVDSLGRVVAYDRWHWRTARSNMQSDTKRSASHKDSTSRVDARIDTLVKQIAVEAHQSAGKEKKDGLHWWQKVLMVLGIVEVIRMLLWVKEFRPHPTKKC